MRIVNARRVSQVFFLVLFLGLCVVATLGARWWQLRGWPINLFIELDPLAAIGTLLTTRTVYAGLALSLLTILLTLVFGRFFCGWVCPFGTIHQAVGYLGRRSRTRIEQMQANRYRRAQRIKYYLLVGILGAAAGSTVALLTARLRAAFPLPMAAGALLILAILALTRLRRTPKIPPLAGTMIAVGAAWAVLGAWMPVERMLATSLQSGLLDPISLMHRSVNLVLLPIADRVGAGLSVAPRAYQGAGFIGALFLAAIALNLVIPRFYCRFVCPLGALLGVIGRYSLWRIGKAKVKCSMCMRCERDCEGACDPATAIRISECVLCMNCLRTCDDEVIRYSTSSSASGEIAGPDLTRRGLLVSIASGFVAIPAARLSGLTGANWNPRLIRPPGSIPETDFLNRCIKCGQCMRACPTNIIHPAGLEAGVEGLWTPTLNFRIGTSGCQYSCVTCGNVCPTAAIRPLSLDEKQGAGAFERRGPVRLGAAFVDQGRCLPWSMGRPCIVCQENCPVSPKAIYIREDFQTVRDGDHAVAEADELTVDLGRNALRPGAYATGDYFCRLAKRPDEAPHRIVANTAAILTFDSNSPMDPPPRTGDRIQIQVRLQRPVVDPKLCIGCGTCEHECPVSGIRAIRVTADNESRDPGRSILI